MKKIKISYWIFTVLFAVFMGFTAIPDAMMDKEAVKMVTHLGYPLYFIPFIGVAKILGSIAILIPGFPRIKEWAYAGLFFDLIAATHSMIKVEGFLPGELFMILPFTLGILSYVFYQKYYQPFKVQPYAV